MVAVVAARPADGTGVSLSAGDLAEDAEERKRNEHSEERGRAHLRRELLLALRPPPKDLVRASVADGAVQAGKVGKLVRVDLTNYAPGVDPGLAALHSQAQRTDGELHDVSLRSETTASRPQMVPSSPRAAVLASSWLESSDSSFPVGGLGGGWEDSRRRYRLFLVAQVSTAEPRIGRRSLNSNSPLISNTFARAHGHDEVPFFRSAPRCSRAVMSANDERSRP